jgi:subtilisin family serine protease
LAGESFSTAWDFGQVSGSRTVQGYVGGNDHRDVFRFELSRDSDVTITLDGLRQDVDLFLHDSSGRLLQRSMNSGRQADSVAQTLRQGTYYVVVDPYWFFYSNYRLSLNAALSESAPPDGAGNRLDEARDLGVLDDSLTLHDWVGASDTADFYRFHLDGESRVEIALGDLQADVDLFLLGSDGSVIAQSAASGNRDESIIESLGAGEFFALARPWGGAESSYSIFLEAERTGAPDLGTDSPFPDVDYFGGLNDWNLNAINAPEVWAQGFTGEGVVAAVVDTGVDLTHPELVPRLWVNADEIPGNRRDDDGNGYVDDVRGWDFAHGDNDPDDQNGHGTHVAGTIAAAKDGRGATGVAPGATIMPVQVLDDGGSGSSFTVAAGIRYAVDNGADIINLSLGGGFSAAIFSALQYAAENAVMVIAASGNRGASSPDYPAAHASALTNVLSVEAHTSQNVKAGFSNGAAGVVQVAAPGVGVYSTLPGDGSGRLSGTSMAAPHVTGLAALALSANSSLTPDRLRTMIVEGSDRFIVGSDGSGGVNAAVTVARADSSADRQSSPTTIPAGLSSGSGITAGSQLQFIPRAARNALLTTARDRSVVGSRPGLSAKAEDDELRVQVIDTLFAQLDPTSLITGPEVG